MPLVIPSPDNSGLLEVTVAWRVIQHVIAGVTTDKQSEQWSHGDKLGDHVLAANAYATPLGSGNRSWQAPLERSSRPGIRAIEMAIGRTITGGGRTMPWRESSQ